MVSKNGGLKPSPAMKKAIKNIELALDIKYRGKTFEDAKEFISEHLEESKKVDLREVMKPSKKMMEKIEKIEQVFGIEYRGCCMRDASSFLEENLPKLIEFYNSKTKNNKR